MNLFQQNVIARENLKYLKYLEQKLRSKKILSPDDVRFQWQLDLAANGYNLWYVGQKQQIPMANQANQQPSGPAIAVSGCAVPAPAPGPTCSDVGAVSRGAPTIFFYQAHAYCDATTEGP